MKTKNNAGFSLVEVLVAIVLLGTLVVPICSSLVLTFRMNEKTDAMLQARLAVSSAAETLLAEGIDEQKIDAVYDGRTDISLYTGAENETPVVNGEKTTRISYQDGSGRFTGVQVSVYVRPSQFVDGDNAYKNSYDCYIVKVVSSADESVYVTTRIQEKGA